MEIRALFNSAMSSFSLHIRVSLLSSSPEMSVNLFLVVVAGNRAPLRNFPNILPIFDHVSYYRSTFGIRPVHAGAPRGVEARSYSAYASCWLRADLCFPIHREKLEYRLLFTDGISSATGPNFPGTAGILGAEVGRLLA